MNDARRIVWVMACICLTGLVATQASAEEFETLDGNSSLRVEGWWRVAQDDGLDRVFFNATFRNDGTISTFLANRFDYRLTMTSGDTYKGTVTSSECYFDFGWDPWSSPCGDRIEPGALGHAVIGFSRVGREGYPGKLTILARFEEAVVREFAMPEMSAIPLTALILATAWGTYTLRRGKEKSRH